MKSPQRLCLMVMMALVGACGSDISATSNDSGEGNTDTSTFKDTNTGSNTDTGVTTDTHPDTATDTDTEPATKYNVYFGLLHSHTNISDGEGSPEKAYRYARDTAKLDFFGIADHDYYPDDMTAADWKTIKDAANSFNQDGA
ncbi:MAG: hypothetical protein MUC50_24340, partial [Myxococcota bacterium]|nr:hypothetical protein [Myxococcota bacterium]